MESKRSPRHPDNQVGLPNTIVIQLTASQGPVNAMPLQPGPQSPVEQQRRPAPLVPNKTKRSRAPSPPGRHSKVRSEMCAPPRRRAPSAQCSAPGNIQGNIDITNQPPSPGRAVLMEYFYNQAGEMIPSHNPPARSACNCFSCVSCRHHPRTIPEPEPLVMEQVPARQKQKSTQASRNSANTASRRDQATNTEDQPLDLESLKVICETLGRAMVTAATAAIEAAVQKLQAPPVEKGILVQRHPEEYDRQPQSKQSSFADSIQLFEDTSPGHEISETRRMPSDILSPTKYRTTPRHTLGGSLPPGGNRKSNLATFPVDSTRRSTKSVRTWPMVKQSSSSINGPEGMSIRRRYPTAESLVSTLLDPAMPQVAQSTALIPFTVASPTEELPAGKQENKPGPTSPNTVMPLEIPSEDLGLSKPDLTIDVSPPSAVELPPFKLIEESGCSSTDSTMPMVEQSDDSDSSPSQLQLLSQLAPSP